MRTFIWKSYGTIVVWEAETPTQLKLIINEILNSINDWGLDIQVNKVKFRLDSPDVSDYTLTVCINYLLDEIGVGTHELFEQGTGWSPSNYR